MEVADIESLQEVDNYNLVETAAAKTNVLKVVDEKMGILLLPEETDNSAVGVVDHKAGLIDSHNYFDYSLLHGFIDLNKMICVCEWYLVHS